MPFTATNRQWRWPIPLLARLVAICLCITVAPLAASAQSSNETSIGGPMLRPVGGTDPYFSVELNPGESIALQIDVINPTADALPVFTYAIDALTLVNGGFGVEAADDEPSAPTTWLEYPEMELTLEPGTAARMPIELTIPEETEPGEYLTAIAAEQADPAPIDGAPGFDQQRRQAVAIFIVVPGEMETALSFADPSWAPGSESSSPVIQIPIENIGDRYLSPQGTFSLTDIAGNLLSERSVAFGAIYAGTSTRLELGIETALAPGVYTLTLELSDERTGWVLAPEQGTMRITIT